MKTLDRICIGAMIRANQAKDKVKEFLEAQDGVSNVVATIVILLIVMLLITMFWNRLKVWAEQIMDKIFAFDFT